MASSLLCLFISSVLFNFAAAQNFSELIKIERILYKRDALANILRDDPNSQCRNGGIYAGGQCHCIHPHTGPNCQDFACVHGISVGARYDPNSLLFSKPCICNDQWKGDMCELHLKDRCNQRGEWKHGKCECIGSFFGDECQYTSRCDQGFLKYGRCICHRHFQGDYCERAVCFHGYADHSNHSLSCVCPVKYKGLHCDECSQVGKHLLPYPKCVVDFLPQARITRKQAKHQNKSRLYIIVGSILFLAAIFAFMVVYYRKRQQRQDPRVEAIRMRALQERQRMLTDAALHANEPDSAQNTIQSVTKKQRRRSLPNIFKMKRSASSDRALRVRDPSGNSAGAAET